MIMAAVILISSCTLLQLIQWPQQRHKANYANSTNISNNLLTTETAN